MKRNFQKLLYPLFISIALLSVLLTTNNVYSQSYCKPYYSYAGNYMGIEYVVFNDLVNKTEWSSSPGYNFYDDKVLEVRTGEVVYFEVGFGNTYEMELAIYIDWNQDGKFDTETELVYGTIEQFSSWGYSDKFIIPDDAKTGTTRMRVMTEDSYMDYMYPSDPCGSNYYYGECEDYVVKIAPNAPDASIVGVLSPQEPFRVGDHNISVSLKSGNPAPLQNVWIDWWLNGVQQRSYFWKGYLTEGKTEQVNLGVVNLDYPANSDYGPFQVKFTTRSPNGFDEDANPMNDSFAEYLYPILNDAGITGFFGPPEGFGPGVTQVRARVRNYAPKPLTSITINWKIDNVAQTPITINGLNIARDQYKDIVIGTYDFYAKTPLGPFNVECVSSKPNGVNDEDQSNDKYVGGIGPSLAAGTYVIGGSNAHFSSPAEAASYLNSSGVFGKGKVTFMINQGTYTGQIILNNPLPNNNPIDFIGNSQFDNDIVITANSTAQNNFVVLLENLTDITFKNMKFRNKNTNTSNAGNLLTLRNSSGLTFENINFEGVANSPRNKVEYSLVNLLNCTKVIFTNNSFNYGSVAFYSNVDKQILPYISVFNNEFYNFSWLGLYNKVADNIKVGNIVIDDNRFVSNSGLVPTGGIFTMNSTTISSNTFNGIVGTGNVNDGVIYVKHNSQDPTNVASITNNKILFASNTNGIFIEGAEIFVNSNYVYTSQSTNYGLSAFRLNNSKGFIGNNQFIGKDMSATLLTNSPKTEFYYNSFMTESNTLATLNVNGNGIFKRNIFTNNANGLVYQITGTPIFDQNILYTRGNVLITENGKNHSGLSTWQAKGNDLGSEIALVEFESFNDLRIKYYNAALFKSVPMFEDKESMGGIIESVDMFGTPRVSYFLGSHELILTITIQNQSEGFVDCVGTTDNYITVSSTMDYNAPMTYQWEQDGRPIPGENQQILYFKDLAFSQSGMYRCKISGPGATKSVYSRPVSVFVANQTEITRQPVEQKIPLGSLATLTFVAHVNGKPIEDAILNDEVQVQWYKYLDESNSTQLKDNLWLSGTRSNYFTIRNFKKSDEGEYFAIIAGLCGKVKTDRVRISEEILDLIIESNPQTQTACEGKTATFTVDGYTNSTRNIIYKWLKDDVELNNIDGKISGVNTNTLNINNLTNDDEGQYSAELVLEGTDLVKTSSYANLNIETAPKIVTQPEDINVEVGKSFSLDVNVKGAGLSYKWYKNGEMIFTSQSPIYEVPEANEDNNGEYYVVISNDCGSVKSNVVRVNVTVGATTVTELSKNGYSLTSAMPNPATGISMIGFSIPTQSYIKLSLTDLSGASRTVLAEGTYEIGTHSINIDVNKLNLSNGTYFYFLEANGVHLTQKLIVIK